MRHFAKTISASSVLVMMLGSLSLTPVSALAESGTKSAVEQGKEIAFSRKKGNCLACHSIKGGNLPGNIAPPLVAMKQRFADKAKLREQIYDSTVANPNSTMPPFGRHKILSDKEIDLVTDFIHQL